MIKQNQQQQQEKSFYNVDAVAIADAAQYAAPPNYTPTITITCT